LYTWFPFKLTEFGEVHDIILLDEWVFENNDRFLENAHLYPERVPKNYMGCPIKLGTFGKEPNIIMTENYTQNDGRNVYKLTGLSVEILKLVYEKMNLTIIFLATSIQINLESIAKSLCKLEDGLCDVLSAIIPLMPVFVTSSFDATIPYTYIEIKMLVPCPKAIPRTEKLVTTFTLSVWLTICLVLLLTTAVFWCAGNGPYRFVCNQTHTHQSLSNCFQNAWAIFVAVSFPQQPTNSTLRFFFFLYVSFSFAISTVVMGHFQSVLGFRLFPRYFFRVEYGGREVDSTLSLRHLEKILFEKVENLGQAERASGCRCCRRVDWYSNLGFYFIFLYFWLQDGDRRS
jgi:hypothetical protein